jgi:hypothetical protein
MKKNKRLLGFLLLTILVLSSLSCNLTKLLSQAVNPEPVVLQPEAPIQLPQAPSGQAFTFSITESQISEYAANAVSTNPDSPIKNPVVRLPEGLIEITGQIEQGLIKADIRLLARPYPDANGNLKVDLVEADFGPIPLNSSMRDTISAYIEGLLTAYLGTVNASYYLDTIIITGGVLTLAGQSR